MSKLTDQSYLSNIQYKNSSNLIARATLQQKYSTNPTGWHDWVFSQFDLSPDCKLLEIGCGPGSLWKTNLSDIQENWSIILSDLSAGMLEEAREALRSSNQFRYSVADAGLIPFPTAVFDVVVANHMLYHVPSIPAVFAEIQRVLRPGGQLYATTNGSSHMQEIQSWRKQYYPIKTGSSWGTPAKRFGLENGEKQLLKWFQELQLRLYPDHLFVTETEPIIQYIQSYQNPDIDRQDLVQLSRDLQKQIDKNGGIKITKETGLFITVKR